VLLDGTNEPKFFSTYVDEDAYIELVTAESEATLLQGKAWGDKECRLAATS